MGLVYPAVFAASASTNTNLTNQMHIRIDIFCLLGFVAFAKLPTLAQQPAMPVILIETKVEIPEWASAERELFARYDSAAQMFANEYLADNGYFKGIERWGGNDGPDDVMENFAQWPLYYALGGSDEVLRLFEKAWEGHIKQYTNAKVPMVEMAKDGMFHKEFITSFDWEHNGEGLAAFNFYGLANPYDSLYKERMVRFAGFYLNEDPEAPNYDREHKIIRSLHNGSLGPKLTEASEIDWGGEPVENHPERLSRYRDAGNIKGDHPLNLLATTLATNAFMLTGSEKYKNWILEYVSAWRDRILSNGGNIPSNIGLDGSIGGEWDGHWYGGTFGWNFSPESALRNYSFRGPRVAMGNALLLTGDSNFIEPLVMQMDNLFKVKQMKDSLILLPNKFGPNGWYGYIPNKHRDLSLDIYLWSMDSANLRFLPNDPWIDFLEGKNKLYPLQTFHSESDAVKTKIQEIQNANADGFELQSDDPQKLNPIKVGNLVRLTTGGNDPGIIGNTLHCQVRYFDPTEHRPGLPDDVAALVEKVLPEGIELTLVNTNPKQEKTIILQAGAYGEHQFTEAQFADKHVEINQKTVKVHLAAKAGGRIKLKMKRYVNTPSLGLPWTDSSVDSKL